MCRSRRELSNEYLLAKSASIQPRTSLSKFGEKFNSLFIRLLSQPAAALRALEGHVLEEVRSAVRLRVLVAGARVDPHPASDGLVEGVLRRHTKPVG